MKSYQLIVFDWDGTLMDSTGHIVNCMRQGIDKLALPPLDDDSIRHIIGLGLNEAVQALYPDADNDTWQSLADAYRHAWLTTPEETPFFENAEPLLKSLAKQDIFLGVATGKSRRGLDRVLKNSGFESLFHKTRCADESQSKPHPQMLLEIMDYLGVYPQDALMIGDTQFDMLMAQNAGADGLAITHGAHDEEKLRECDAKDILHDLYQVEHWLASTGISF